MANTVTIEFGAKGDKDVIKAINKLDASTKKLINTQAKIIDSNNQNTNSTKKQRDGMKRLFIQLKANNLSFKNLGLSTDILTKAFAGNRIAIEKVRIAIKKLKQEQEKADVTTRILGGTFAVLRSKLLLVGFAVGTIARPIMNIVNLSTRLESVSQAFETLSGGTNKSSIAMNKLKQATDNTMSSFDLFKQANNAMILGVTKNSDEMAEMFDIAQRLGKALGRDTASSVESLITGIGRQSRLMLDNIGIIVKSEEAYNKYAKSINKTAKELTDSEKKQAFFNATMESARAKVALLGDEIPTTQDRFSTLSVSFEEAGESIGTTLTPAILAMAGALKSGADTAKLFFDTINKSLGLGQDEEELPISIQIENLKFRINDLVDKGLVKVSSEMDLFGTTMGALPFEDSIFSLTEMGNQSRFTQSELDKMIQEISRLSKLEDIEFQTSAEPFDIDTSKKIAEELKQLTVDQEAIRVENAKKVAEELRKISREIANDEKRIEREKQAVRKAVLGETTEFQLEQLRILEKKFLEHNESTTESEKFFANEKKRIIEEGNEEQLKLLEQQKKQSDLALGFVNKLSGALQQATLNGQHMGEAVVNSLQAIAIEMASKAFIFTAFQALGIGGVGTAGKTLSQFLGLAHTGGLIKEDGNIQRFAYGGQVQGQDNVPIMAQAGEFVIRKAVVEQVGVDNLARLNSGEGNVGSTVNVNINGNMIGNEEFVRDTLIPEINKTVRQGLA